MNNETIRSIFAFLSQNGWNMHCKECGGHTTGARRFSGNEKGTLSGTVLNAAVNQGRAALLAAILGTNEEVTAENFPYEIADGKYVWIPYQKVTLKNAADFE